MTKVLIGPAGLAGIQGAFLDTLLKAGFEPVYHGSKAQLVEDQLMKVLPGIEASLAGSEPYSAKVLAANPQLKVIARVGVGWDAVDTDAATKNGTVVTITPGTNQGSVAEHTFCMMLALVKNLIPQHLGVKNGGWPRGTNIPLRGRTIGIAGLGRIGKAVATRALAFEMKVVAHDPFPDTKWAAEHKIPMVSLEELLQRSDFVSLHMPAMPETAKMINANTLALMKPTAYLLNTSRGAVVDEDALYTVLKEKRIAGAGLDVFDQEPPGKNPLLELDNVVMTPHAAGVDLQSRDEMSLSAAEAVVSFKKGEWPSEKIVNKEVKDRFRW
jgi:phosphoglycerate dehydrogenase-like enzyme